MCRPPDVHHKQIDIRGFSAGSYVGAAVALIASRISRSFRLHVTSGGIAMSQATLVHLCGLAALKCDTAPQHHVRLVHFLTDKLCGWRPTPLATAKWLMQHIHYTLVESAVVSSKWTSLKARGMPMHLRSHMLISAPSMFDGDSHFALPAGCRALASNSIWAPLWTCCILMTMNSVGKSLLASPDHKTAHQVRLQVKDLVLDNMIITLGAKQTIEWLSTIARKLLRPLPLKALTVLTHAFLPQLTYEGETAIASQPFVSKASLDGMEVTATAIACGQEFLHEFWFQFPSSRAPVAF